MFSEEHLYSIALRHCPQIGDLHFKKNSYHNWFSKKAWNLPKHELVKLYGIGNKIVEDIGKDSHLQFAERELEFCYKNNIQILLSHQEISRNYYISAMTHQLYSIRKENLTTTGQILV